MSSAFSSAESTLLERDVEIEATVSKIDEIWNKSELERTVAWIRRNKFEKVSFHSITLSI